MSIWSLINYHYRLSNSISRKTVFGISYRYIYFVRRRQHVMWMSSRLNANSSQDFNVEDLRSYYIDHRSY